MFIGLKPAPAAPTLATGVVPAMTRAQVLEAHEIIEAQGVKIERSFASIPAVAATIVPEAAPQLRTLPIVNYIEPGRTSEARRHPRGARRHRGAGHVLGSEEGARAAGVV